MSINQFQVDEKKETSFVFPISNEGENNQKRVQVHKFRGKILIDIRELYNKDDEWLPSKKGLSLNVDQYKKLRKMMSLIDEAIGALGGELDEEKEEKEE